MNHYVPLERLPEDLEFPDDLKERIWYEASSRRLACNGFMSKALFDRLEQLHDDSDYRRALEDLFRIATPDAPRPGVFARWLRPRGRALA